MILVAFLIHTTGRFCQCEFELGHGTLTMTGLLVEQEILFQAWTISRVSVCADILIVAGSSWLQRVRNGVTGH
jgi:hypothetical protein